MGFLCGSPEVPERSLAASFRYGSGRGVCFDHDKDTTRLIKGILYSFECDYLAQTRMFYITLYDVDNGETIGTLTRHIDVANLPPIFGFGFCAEPNPAGLYYWIRGDIDDVWIVPDPYDWYTYPANGHQYALTLQHSNWVSAEAEAVAVGGHLVTINDQAECDWLVDVNSNPFGLQYSRNYYGNAAYNLVWIGLSYIGGDKTLPSSWMWQNGEPVGFWNPSPQAFDPQFIDGIHMYMNGSTRLDQGTWAFHSVLDLDPSKYLRGVIEYVPQLIIRTPNGGENLPQYSTYMITWETYSKIPVDDVLLEYSRDNGQAWESIGIVENTGSYEWEVPDANSDQCLVRVSNSQYPVISDTSDSVFTIYECQKVLIGDLNNDCYINFYDIALIAFGWLDCGNPFDPACGL